jgi:hypothetical protein
MNASDKYKKFLLEQKKHQDKLKEEQAQEAQQK